MARTNVIQSCPFCRGEISHVQVSATWQRYYCEKEKQAYEIVQIPNMAVLEGSAKSIGKTVALSLQSKF